MMLFIQNSSCIDKSGTVVISPFTTGLPDGVFVIEPVYSKRYEGFCNGYAIVSQGEELICIDKSGEEMWRLLPEE